MTAVDPKVSYVRAGRFLFLLIVIGLLLSVYADYIRYSHTRIDFGIEEVIGGALGGAFLPAVVILPWRLLQRRTGQFTNAPVIVGGVLFVLLWVGIFYDAWCGADPLSCVRA